MSPTEVDAMHASYAEGRRDERETWRREVEALRDDCLRIERSERADYVSRLASSDMANHLTALLARLAPVEAPAGPDLRAMEKALRKYGDHSPDCACYTYLDDDRSRILEEARCDCGFNDLLDKLPKTAAAPSAPKEWRGPWKCTSSGRVYEPGEEWRHKNEGADECHGTLVPYERRKGGEG